MAPYSPSFSDLLAHVSHFLQPTISLQAQAEWEEKEQERLAALASVTNKAARKQAQQQEEEQQFVAYVPLPDQKAIEQLVLQKKKQELLSKYTSEALAKQQEAAKSLLNKR